MRISEAFDIYKKVIMVKGYSRRVIEHHDYVKGKLIEYVGDKNIAKLTLDEILEWEDAMKTKELPDGTVIERCQNTLRSDMQRLKGVMKYMFLINEPCLNYHLIPVPRSKNTERCFLYEWEVQAMIDHAYSLRNKFIISLLYSSGVRLSEMLSLNRDSINNRTFTIIGKGDKMRICFIDERTEKLMQEYLASRHDNSDALLISNVYKERLSASNVQLLIRNSAKRAGIEKHVTPHVLRHSFATNFLREGGNVRYLSRLLGHSCLNTTAVYTHIVDNDLKEQYAKFHTT